MRELNIAKANLHRLIRRCKSEEIWEQVEQEVAQEVKALLETGLECCRDEYVQCQWHERSQARRSYRNGYYERGLITTFGNIQAIRVPRVRQGRIEQPFFDWYVRRRKEFDEAVKQCFLLGCSTRKAGIAARQFAGQGVSATTVSTILKQLDQHVALFHQQPIEDDIVVLQVDALWVHVRKVCQDGYVKRAVLLAVGLTRQGYKRILALRVVNRENHAHWTRFLNDLYHRGLQGNQILAVVHDGVSGLQQAIAYVYPHAVDQPCVVHRARNASDRCQHKKNKTPFFQQAVAVWDADSEKLVRQKLQAFVTAWISKEPQAVAHLLNNFENTLGYLALPKPLHSLSRCTNLIENTILQIRRRIRPMGCFANNASVQRIVYGLVYIENQNNQEHTLFDPSQAFTHFS